jgi:uncharacterized protein (TIGR02646 family)
MRLIKKGPEPRLLLAYRKTEGAHYEGLPSDAKAELRAALVRDQHGLCCFCMGRVEATVAPVIKVKVAHWMPQRVDKTRDLDWSNLLAACTGNEGASYDKQHCDTRQGNEVLRISPCDETHVASLSYSARGEILTSRDDLREDVEKKLNLNHETLRAGRDEAVKRMAGALSKRHSGAFPKTALEAALKRCRTPDASGNLTPYAGAVEWWLTKRLRRASA